MICSKPLIGAFLFLCLGFQLMAQHHFVVISQPKTKNGCGTMSLEKIEVSNKADLPRLSETMRQQHRGSNYKEYFISEDQYAIVYKSTAQYRPGSCTYQKYELIRGKKSLEDVRNFAKSHFEKYKGLYASTPEEHTVFSPKLAGNEKSDF